MNPKKAFTLIELLVVIAIIALLAAILFPVFSRVRENARKASCASNLKQLSLGIAQYTQDYDEMLPSYIEGSALGNVYLPARLDPYIKDRQIWKCPSSSWAGDDWNGTIGDWSVSYGINMQIGGDSSTVSLAAINKASETVLAAEGSLNNNTGACSVDPLHINTARPFARHSELLNVSFVDGHVKAFRKEAIEKTATAEDGNVLSGDAVSVFWNTF